jgi:hypothetical protein
MLLTLPAAPSFVLLRAAAIAAHSPAAAAPPAAACRAPGGGLGVPALAPLGGFAWLPRTAAQKLQYSVCPYRFGSTAMFAAGSGT